MRSSAPTFNDHVFRPSRHDHESELAQSAERDARDSLRCGELRRNVGADESDIEVARGGVEPPTSHFSGERSYQLSYLAATTARELLSAQ